MITEYPSGRQNIQVSYTDFPELSPPGQGLTIHGISDRIMYYTVFFYYTVFCIRIIGISLRQAPCHSPYICRAPCAHACACVRTADPLHWLGVSAFAYSGHRGVHYVHTWCAPLGSTLSDHFLMEGSPLTPRDLNADDGRVVKKGPPLGSYFCIIPVFGGGIQPLGCIMYNTYYFCIMYYFVFCIIAPCINPYPS